MWDVAPELPLNVALEFQLLRGQQKMALRVARWAPQDESESVPVCLLLVRSARASSLREQPAQASQRAESQPPERSLQEQQQAEPAWELGAQPPQVAARGPQASAAQLAAQAPQERQPDASARL